LAVVEDRPAGEQPPEGFDTQLARAPWLTQRLQGREAASCCRDDLVANEMQADQLRRIVSVEVAFDGVADLLIQIVDGFSLGED
jgi:hypothetical protein